MNIELDVEKNLQAQVAKDRIRIKEFFIDFDKLRKGVVGEAAFRTCLGTLNFQFKESEIRQLLTKYTQTGGLVDYATFCANIDKVFSYDVNHRDFIENSKSTATFSESELDTLCQLLACIRSQIKNQRILIKPQFMDYDKTKSCHITVEQFRRVMKEIKLIPPSEELF